MTNIQIPSGLIDSNVELFNVPGGLLGIHSGAVKDIFELPTTFLRLATEQMHSKPSTVMALTMAGYNDGRSQLIKYLSCRFGGFDLNADFKDGKFSESEYHECGFRGQCPMEGIVCDFVKINGQIISPFEIEIIKLLATEDTIPVIAQKLGISLNNFESKKKLLFAKLSVLSRPRLVAVCYDNQILNPAICSPS